MSVALTPVCKFIFVTKTHCGLYFQLALRAGHEKDEETADTVGCCSLRVEHISKYFREHFVALVLAGQSSLSMQPNC